MSRSEIVESMNLEEIKEIVHPSYTCSNCMVNSFCKFAFSGDNVNGNCEVMKDGALPSEFYI